jgi:hypothetical protein
MEKCWSEMPPKYLPDADRLASCFLHSDKPKLANEDVSMVFTNAGTEDTA